MHYFFGEPLIPRREQAYIKQILAKYKGKKADESLKKAIWEDLQREKSKGNIKVPFKVALRLDPSNQFPSYVEVILDTKV